MSNASLAAQAVAAGPAGSAPGSFDGLDWLVAVNLAVFTAGFIIGLMFACEQARHLWRNRARDLRTHPVTIWRTILLMLFTAMFLRCGAAAAVLWRWNVDEPAATGAVLTLQRFIDPVAMTLGILALTLAVLASRGFVDQLRRNPIASQIWASLPMLVRPGLILLASMIAAAGVVATR